jgi:hypothetical protein
LRDLVEACLTKEPGGRPTPAEVAGRLAPEGAARLVTGGWLPGPLVEQVSRAAVQLLNLEAAGSAGQVASGPVGFSSPSVGEGAVRGDAGAREFAVGEGGGAFGPPPVMPASTPAPSGSPLLPEPRDEPRRPDATAPPFDERTPGKVAVSVAATSVPGDGGRGRRLSCTVALAVAGALAAVTVGSVFVFDLLPGIGADDTGGSNADSAPSTSPSPPSQTSSEAAGLPAKVPARYLGTWEGQGSGLDGTVPMGTFRLTVHRAAVGEELGKLRQTDILGGVCDDVLTLKKVTKTQLIATSVGAKTNHDGCNPAAHTVRLTPEGDDLTYQSESAAEGNPEARMSRVE